MYKVALRGSSVYVGRLHQSLPRAREAKRELGSEYHIYRIVNTITKYGKVLRSWEKVE